MQLQQLRIALGTTSFDSILALITIFFMNNHQLPKITIIIAVFNSAKTLQQCIDSVT